MKKTFKFLFLGLIIIILMFLTVKQSIKIFQGIKVIEMPTKQSRNLSELGIYNIMTPKELSLKYNISVEEIFNQLNIVPEEEDYSSSLKELRKKYKKTPDEFQSGLRLIIDPNGNPGDPNE